MINSYKIFWKKGFDFKGVSTRNEYWLGAVLANQFPREIGRRFDSFLEKSTYNKGQLAHFLCQLKQLFQISN